MALVKSHCIESGQNDHFLGLADRLLSLNLYGKYSQYLELLHIISKEIFDTSQKIKILYANHLDDEIQEIISKIKKKINEILDPFVLSVCFEDIRIHYAFINFEISFYNQRYFLNQAEKIWIQRKIKIEEYQKFNCRFIAMKSYNERMSCFEIVKNCFFNLIGSN